MDFNKEGELEGAITEKTKMVWLETPTNPTLKITDIRRVAAVAKQHNLLLVVDNTFMSPYFQVGAAQRSAGSRAGVAHSPFPRGARCRTRWSWARTLCCTA